ncbi:hypothetical protein BT93_H0657 [Corymbia citriodora subsp. variegata]|nr:hypothetical protein BT93_H0657 [Corymbia citriodora subsp. variegata]
MPSHYLHVLPFSNMGSPPQTTQIPNLIPLTQTERSSLLILCVLAFVQTRRSTKALSQIHRSSTRERKRARGSLQLLLANGCRTGSDRSGFHFVWSTLFAHIHLYSTFVDHSLVLVFILARAL